jgi:S-methylmethionine-dependent homocysteine/selenocysteine methylase
MAGYRNQLPQLEADAFLTDGGIETTLIFHDGFDLPDFAAFTLLGDEPGRAALARYYDSYVAIARRDRVGIVLDTATWRASPDWGARLGYDGERLAGANRDAVALLESIRRDHESAETPVVISGCIGPRGDGYRPESLMTPDEAREYHSFQTAAFAGTGADLVSALTMTHSAEAIGAALAARDAHMPAVISFTVETDGALPSGESIASAVDAVDRATDGYPAYFMINCAHPTHFAATLEAGGDWTRRVRGIRANASRMSHDELDAAEDLDEGDPDELAALYRELRATQPQITVLGGCCGTDDRHISAISTATTPR